MTRPGIPVQARPIPVAATPRKAVVVRTGCSTPRTLTTTSWTWPTTSTRATSRTTARWSWSSSESCSDSGLRNCRQGTGTSKLQLKVRRQVLLQNIFYTFTRDNPVLLCQSSFYGKWLNLSCLLLDGCKKPNMFVITSVATGGQFQILFDQEVTARYLL